MERHFGKYTLLERLGGGGMAEVFRARLSGPKGFEKQLALKLILSYYSDEPEFVRMFIQEATLAAHLDHANIVRIYEFDQIDGRYYIAMELVSGKDLRKLMVRASQLNRSIRIPEIVVVALETCKGLAFAHGEIAPNSPKIVHRDISPHNIIISNAGEVKISDFGIAKLASSATVTKTGYVKGKAAYMAPEQAKGDTVDHRCDLFSLGCVIWELLTNRRLFSGDNELAIVENLIRDSIEPPSTYNPKVPKEMDEVVLQMLQRDSDKRPDSASDLAKSFDRMLHGFPGVDRTMLLVDLYQELFSENRERTAILPSKNEPAETRLAEKSDEIYQLIEQAGKHVTESSQIPKRRWNRLGIILSGILIAGITFLLLRMTWQNGTQEPIEELPGTEPTPALSALIPSIPVVTTQDDHSNNRLEEGKQPTSIDEDKGEEKTKRNAEQESESKTAGLSSPRKKPIRSARKQKNDKGFLDLNAIPWARVYWRKRFLGPTPLQNIELPPGEHTLLLENRDLGIRKMVPVRIDSRRKTKHLVNLLKK